MSTLLSAEKTLLFNDFGYHAPNSLMLTDRWTTLKFDWVAGFE
jgi:hypothetical protein